MKKLLTLLIVTGNLLTGMERQTESPRAIENCYITRDIGVQAGVIAESGLLDLVHQYLELVLIELNQTHTIALPGGKDCRVRLIPYGAHPSEMDISVNMSKLECIVPSMRRRIQELIAQNQELHKLIIEKFMPLHDTSNLPMVLEFPSGKSIRINSNMSVQSNSVEIYDDLMLYIQTKKEFLEECAKLKTIIPFLKAASYVIDRPKIQNVKLYKTILGYARKAKEQLKKFKSFENFLSPEEYRAYNTNESHLSDLVSKLSQDMLIVKYLPQSSVTVDELRRITSTTQCGHSYHSYCLGKWVSDNSTCPSCRTPVFFSDPTEDIIAPTSSETCNICLCQLNKLAEECSDEEFMHEIFPEQATATTANT